MKNQFDNPKFEELNSGAIVEADYFLWLENLGDEKGHYSLRRDYLIERGFVVGKDTVSLKLLSYLKTIHVHYYWLKYKEKRNEQLQ